MQLPKSDVNFLCVIYYPYNKLSARLANLGYCKRTGEMARVVEYAERWDRCWALVTRSNAAWPSMTYAICSDSCFVSSSFPHSGLFFSQWFWLSTIPLNAATTSLLLWQTHDDIIRWKHFRCYWSFARGIRRSPVTGEFPSQRPVTRIFGVFFDLWLNKRMSEQSRRRWTETPLHSL